MSRAPVRALVAAAVAAGLTYAGYLAIPGSLDVRTDIVGYPTLANFNIDRYFWQYGLAVVFLPLAAVGLYLLLTRVFLGRLTTVRPLPEPSHQIEAIPEVAGWREWAVAMGRTLLVGAVLGFEVAIVIEEASEAVVMTTLAYGAGVIVVGWLASRLGRRDRFDAMSVVNTLATPFLIAGLWGMSRATELMVTSSGEVRGYPWLPAWLAFGAAITLLAYLVIRIRQAPGREARGSLERWTAILVAAPVGLFVFTAFFPGELGTLDSFEDGQVLAGTELTRAGAFPWRDILFSHGLLFDVGRGLFGFGIFDESRWGVVAGDGVLLVPLAWIALYYLCAYLFWTNWLFLLGTQLLIVCGHITEIQTRMILVPLAFLVFAALLARPSVPLAIAFTAVMVAQIIVTPEALVVGAASFATLVVFEFLYHERGRTFRASYPRTTRCLAVGGVIAVGWAVFLAAYRALGDWALSFAATIPGHRLTGGIESFIPRRTFEVLAPIAVVLVVFAFMSVGVFLRHRFSYKDWVAVAMAGFTLLYFTKFLSRADRPHLEQSFAAAVPVLFYVVFRGITFVEAQLAKLPFIRGVGWFPRRHTLTLPVLVVLLIIAPEPLHNAVRAAPGHFRAIAAEEPEVAGIGYARPGENDARVLRGLEQELGSLLAPGDSVFDFSNAPGVFHYLLDEQPSTRYYHVSYAIRRRTQSDLLDHLRANPAAASCSRAPAPGPGLQQPPQLGWNRQRRSSLRHK